MPYRTAINFIDHWGLQRLSQFLDDCNRGRSLSEMSTYLKLSLGRLSIVRKSLFKEVWVLRPEILDWLEVLGSIEEAKLKTSKEESHGLKLFAESVQTLILSNERIKHLCPCNPGNGKGKREQLPTCAHFEDHSVSGESLEIVS